MRKRTALILSAVFLSAAVLTAGFFNKAGNDEFYMHSLMSDGGKFFVEFDYGKVV